VKSAIRPAITAPAAAPSSTADTVRPSTRAPAANRLPMDDTAPLMTELSYPNRKPPIAATAASRVTVAVDSPAALSSNQVIAAASCAAMGASLRAPAAPRAAAAHPGAPTHSRSVKARS